MIRLPSKVLLGCLTGLVMARSREFRWSHVATIIDYCYDALLHADNITFAALHRHTDTLRTFQWAASRVK